MFPGIYRNVLGITASKILNEPLGKVNIGERPGKESFFYHVNFVITYMLIVKPL